jgi:hypothetical protein
MRRLSLSAGVLAHGLGTIRFTVASRRPRGALNPFQLGRHLAFEHGYALAGPRGVFGRRALSPIDREAEAPGGDEGASSLCERSLKADAKSR